MNQELGKRSDIRKKLEQLEGEPKMRLSSRADVSVEDHRCALCGDKEEKDRGRKRETRGEGGRDKELLLLLS